MSAPFVENTISTDLLVGLLRRKAAEFIGGIFHRLFDISLNNREHNAENGHEVSNNETCCFIEPVLEGILYTAMLFATVVKTKLRNAFQVSRDVRWGDAFRVLWGSEPALVRVLYVLSVL